MTMTKTFNPCDLVVYSSAFLRSVGWYVDVPRDGRVVEVDDDQRWPVVTVHWCDRDELTRVAAVNLVLKREMHLEPC